MELKAFINWKLYDRNGHLIEETEHQANSLVRQFLALLLKNSFDALELDIRDTGNTIRTLATATGMGYVDALLGTTDNGILVGTGTNEVTILDYALQTKIAHGTGAGQLSYGACTVSADVIEDGSDVYFLVSRIFTNNSGGNITIKEAGIATRVGSFYYLLDRTLSEQTIINGNNATLTYKIKISV